VSPTVGEKPGKSTAKMPLIFPQLGIVPKVEKESSERGVSGPWKLSDIGT
jgi:hypothetical protein